MPNQSIPIDQGFYVDESFQMARMDCLNLYAAQVQAQGALNQGMLRSPAGITTFSDAGAVTDPCRAMIVVDDQLCGIWGDRFYTVDNAGVKTALGDVVSGTTRLQMSENGFVAVFIEPNTDNGYFYDKVANTFVKITDPIFLDFGVKVDVTYIDGYFVYVVGENAEFFWGSLVVDNNGKDFNALNFSSADVLPDDNRAILTIQNELIIFGQRSIETFNNTGSDLVFERVPGASIDRGTISGDLTLQFQNSFIFVGAGETEGISMWQGTRGQTQRISTDPVDSILQSVPRDDLENAYLFKYSESGDFFLGITIPNQITLVWNSTNNKWHRRGTAQQETGTARYSHFVQAYNEILVGDTLDGRIGEINLDAFTEYDDQLLRRFETGYIHNAGNRFLVPRAELRAQVGITGIQQIDPVTVKMYISIDNGNLFGSAIDRPFPQQPTQNTRAVWYALGNYEWQFMQRFDVVTDSKVSYSMFTIDVRTSGG